MAECEKVCKYIDLPLQHASNPVLKRMKRPGHAAELRRAARPDPRRASPASRSARPSSSASRARPTADVDELCAFVARPRVRPRRRLHLLARGRHVGVRARRRRAGRGRRRRGGSRVMSLQKRLVAAAPAARAIGERVRMLVDGPSRRPRAGAAGPAATRRPTSTPSVYLTECDPSSLPAGRFRRRSKSSARATTTCIVRPVVL